MLRKIDGDLPMLKLSFPGSVLAAFAASAMAALAPAAAGTVCPIPPSGGVGSESTLCLSYEETVAGTNPAGGTGGVTNPLTVPGTYIYGNTVTVGSSPITGSNAHYGFYDDYVFTIGAGAADSITTTVNLGGLFNITNLGARIYSTSGLGTLPQLNSVTGEIDGSPSGNDILIPTTLLNAGTYVLEIEGNATGSAGGTYSGVLQLSPAAVVPLPASLALFLSGLAGLGLLHRRRSKAA
jgi:hypothetical protein